MMKGSLLIQFGTVQSKVGLIMVELNSTPYLVADMREGEGREAGWVGGRKGG